MTDEAKTGLKNILIGAVVTAVLSAIAYIGYQEHKEAQLAKKIGAAAVEFGRVYDSVYDAEMAKYDAEMARLQREADAEMAKYLREIDRISKPYGGGYTTSPAPGTKLLPRKTNQEQLDEWQEQTDAALRKVDEILRKRGK